MLAPPAAQWHTLENLPYFTGSPSGGRQTSEGDKRTPEGRSIIDGRNLESNDHCIPDISYPDAEDRREARARGVDPDSMIMTHGRPNKAKGDIEGYVGVDWTDGRIAVINAEIEVLLRIVKDGPPIEIRP